MMIALVIIILLSGLVYLIISKPKFSRRLRIDSTVESVDTNDSKLTKVMDKADKYYVQKQFLPAEKAYLKILKIDHKNVHAYNRLGFVYAHQNNIDDALECFKIVLDAKPDASTYQNLGMIYMKKRDFAKAVSMLERSCELKQTTQRLIMLARIYRAMSKYSLQVSTLKKALSIDKNNIPIMQLLAEAYLHEKDKTNAKKIFNKIIKIDPKNSRARQALNQNLS